jgi:hypothetical protein
MTLLSSVGWRCLDRAAFEIAAARSLKARHVVADVVFGGIWFADVLS